MKYCPTCYRAGPQMDECPNIGSVIPCPEPRNEDPAVDVALSCGPCGFSRIIPLKDLLSGKAKNQLPHCTRDNCGVVNDGAPKKTAAPKPAPAADKPKPAPKSE